MSNTIFFMTILIFDLTDSSVNHSVRAVKARMAKVLKFRDYFEGLNSQFKV